MAKFKLTEKSGKSHVVDVPEGTDPDIFERHGVEVKALSEAKPKAKKAKAKPKAKKKKAAKKGK